MKEVIKKIRGYLESNNNILKLNFIINIIIICIAIGINNIDETPWFITFAILSSIQLCVNIYSLLKLGENFISLSTIFIMFSYIFHFGHIIIHALKIPLPVGTSFNVYEIVGSEIYRKSSLFVLIVHCTVTLGILLIWNKFKMGQKKIKLTKDKIEKDLKKVRIIGFTMIIIGIIPLVYIDISKLILFLGGGYLDTYLLSLPGFIYSVANFANIGVLFLVIGFNKNKCIATIITFSMVAYKLIIIFTGNRGPAVVYIVALLIIWSLLIMKFKVKTYFIMGIIGYLMLVVVNFVADIRNLGLQDFGFYVDTFIAGLKGNPIIDIFAEFGSTFITVCFSIMYIPSIIPNSLGINYIGSLLTMFPNIGGFLDPINNKILFSIGLSNASPDKLGLGGSYIGELFYSFNWAGILFEVVVGVLVGFVSYKITTCIKNEQYLPLLFTVTLVSSILWWVRDYFGNIVRDYVWQSCFVIIMLFILNRYWSRINLINIFGGKNNES